MFRKFVEALANAQCAGDVQEILYGASGVDMAYQREKITWKEHEVLFTLAARLAF